MAEQRLSAVTFEEVAAQVRDISVRADMYVREISAPQGLAPDAIALAGDVRPEHPGLDSAYGGGRFVLLHDPDGPTQWGADWRIVAFAQAPLEPEIGTDALLADVAWSWLTDALASHGATYHSASGTATKTLSKGFGSLAAEGDGAQIELRASWSPTENIGAHVHAWCELVCMLAGLPPGSEQIETMTVRRSIRG